MRSKITATGTGSGLFLGAHPKTVSRAAAALRLIAALLLVGAVTVSSGVAATVTRTGDDGFGQTGFNTANGWSGIGMDPPAAPFPGNDYIIQNFDMRTPATTGTPT